MCVSWVSPSLLGIYTVDQFIPLVHQWHQLLKQQLLSVFMGLSLLPLCSTQTQRWDREQFREETSCNELLLTFFLYRCGTYCYKVSSKYQDIKWQRSYKVKSKRKSDVEFHAEFSGCQLCLIRPAKWKADALCRDVTTQEIFLVTQTLSDSWLGVEWEVEWLEGCGHSAVVDSAALFWKHVQWKTRDEYWTLWMLLLFYQLDFLVVQILFNLSLFVEKVRELVSKVTGSCLKWNIFCLHSQSYWGNSCEWVWCDLKWKLLCHGFVEVGCETFPPAKWGWKGKVYWQAKSVVQPVCSYTACILYFGCHYMYAAHQIAADLSVEICFQTEGVSSHFLALLTHLRS